jgi:aminopeptidase N
MTDLQPYGAHKVFPCFDQPCLKARIKVAVIAPIEVKIIAN